MMPRFAHQNESLTLTPTWSKTCWQSSTQSAADLLISAARIELECRGL